MADINITSESLSGYLESFKSEMDKMNQVLSEIEQATTGAKGIWEGEASDTVLGAIESFQQVFSDINAKNENYVTFLNSVIEKYTEADQSGVNTVDSNINSFSV